ncbi:MAG TPA: TonB-dependent receptor [Steroidobacteraceae bacterium]|nr:TonB-dependent receptor [Steroidobacteraceae bacterium]
MDRYRGGLLRQLFDRRVMVSVLLGCAAMAGVASAQDQNGAAAPAADADQAQAGQPADTGQLQEVVVTAERRATDVQTTAIAVTAITGDQLKANNVTSINDLATVAPTLSVANEGGYQLVVMRGVGNTLGEDPVTTGVPVILDSMVNPRGTGLNWAWFDIGDVETLRGPQGTLVGANSTGGAILVNSANPNFRGVNGYATVQAGNFHDTLEEGAINLPISDTFAMRLAMHHEGENSFYHDVGFSGEQLPNASDSSLDPGNTDMDDARLSALWKPTDNFQLLLKVQYDENNTDGTPYNVSPNTFSALPGLGCPYSTLANGQCTTQYYPYYSGNPWVLNYSTFTKFTYWDRIYSGDVRYTFGNGTVFHFYAGAESSVSDEIDANCECSANDGYSIGGNSGITAEPATNDYVQVELISPSAGRFNWIVGAADIYSASPFTSYSYTTGGPPGTSVTTPQIGWFPLNEVTREVGVYGNINWQFTSTLQLMAGLRGNWDNNFGTGTFNIGTIACPAGDAPCNPSPASLPAVLDNSGAYTSNHQTGKIGLNWTPIPGQFFYLFYARGYKPGLSQFHAFNTGEIPAPAETLNDYELGWKGTFLNHRLTNQLGLYYDDYYDMQQNVFNYNIPNNGGIAPVPHALIEGIEESMQAQLGHFGANLSLAYTHSSLSPIDDVPTYEFPAGTGQVLGTRLPQCATGVVSPTCFNYLPYVINLRGVQNPYAPQVTANLTLQYGFQFGEATLQPRVNYSYTSKQYSNILQNNDYYEMVPRKLWNAYLDYMNGRWTTTLYGTNLSNQTYETNQTGTTVLYGAPRQYGIKTTFTF